MVSNQELLDSTASRDPATGLRAVAALRRLVESLEELQVQNARDQGWSWSDIASHMGVSKQAVHKKYARRVDAGASRR
jgi:ribosome-binding protein aMBF1 (putative translation factor)